MAIYPIRNTGNGTMYKERVIREYFYEVTGTLHLVEETKTYDSGFQVKNFILMSEDFYPKPIAFQLVRENIGLVDGIDLGAQVKVAFKLNGREWEGRFFVNLDATAIEVVGEDSAVDGDTDADDTDADARELKPSKNLLGEDLEEDVPF
jgi:single-strand DNA-binding protein